MKYNLRNAWQVIDLYEEALDGKTAAQKIVAKLSETLQPIVSSNKYFKVKFEKDHGDHGIIILKYANVGKDATPKEAEEAKHIMVSLEGFDKEGNILSEDGKIVLHFFKWNLSSKNPGKVKGGVQKVTDFFIRWFKSNLEEITKLTEVDMSMDGGGSPTGGGAMGSWNSVTGDDIPITKPTKCKKCKKMIKPFEPANSFRSTIYDATPQDFCKCKDKVVEAKKTNLDEEGEGGVAPGTTVDGGPVETTGTTSSKNVAVFKKRINGQGTPANRKELWQNLKNEETGGYETGKFGQQ